jgi:hypothetical protein
MDGSFRSRLAWIAGHRPAWVDPNTVGHVPVEQDGDKHANSTANLLAACRDPRVSDPFLWLHDDMFALRDVTELPLVDKGPMERFATDLRARYKQDYPYLVGMEQTLDLIRTQLKIDDPLSYEIHVPLVVHKYDMLTAIDIGALSNVRPLHKRSLYCALHYKPEQSVTVEDPKITFPSAPIDWPDTWVSTSTTSWAGTTGTRIRKTYRTRSTFECD